MKAKKLFSVFLVLIMVLALIPQNIVFAKEYTPTMPSGSGTSDDPYKIYTAEELYWFAGLVNGTLGADIEANEQACAIIMQDIYVNENVLTADGNLAQDTSALAVWEPIGVSYNGFCGSIDGNGKTIYGLYINDTSSYYTGFIRYLISGTVKNLTIRDSYVKSTSEYTGGICGYLSGATLSGCAFYGTVEGTDQTGGLVGGVLGSLLNCTGKVKVTGQEYVGGACGRYSDGSITGSYIESDVKGEQYVGGFAGATSGRVEGCFSSGTAKGVYNVGGFTGLMGGDIYGCYTRAKVTMIPDLESGKIGAFAGNESYSGIKVVCCYFLDQNYSAEDNVSATYGTMLTKEQFKSGEATVRLNNGAYNSSSPVYFGQKLGVDDFPVIMSENNKVYVTSPCKSYTNKLPTEETAHTYKDGVCTACHRYETSVPPQENGIYQVSNDKELYYVAYLTQDTNEYVDVALTNDIVLNENVLNADGTLTENTSSLRQWPIMGNEKSGYTGAFNGNGHTIYGLYINRPNESNVGLIGQNTYGFVRALGIEDSYICGNENVGAVSGTLANSVCLSYVKNTTVNGQNNVGGLVGQSSYWADIESCYSAANVSASKNKSMLVGNEQGNISAAYALSDDGGVFDKTAEQFKSGEVAYLLANPTGSGSTGSTGGVMRVSNSAEDEELNFGQLIGKEDFPVLGGAPVYKTAPCPSYTNSPTATKQHKLKNSVCQNCGEVEVKKPYSINGIYVISNIKELYWFAGLVNGTLTDGTMQNCDADAILTQDITINDNVLKADGTPNSGNFAAWTPIGSYKNPYTGSFYGSGHTISGLYINEPSKEYVGFFGATVSNYINGETVYASVANLNICDSFISGGLVVGGICGVAYEAEISDCSTSAYIKGTRQTGGICGRTEDGVIISNCTNKGTVLCDPEESQGVSGGIVGKIYEYTNIENCTNSGKISAQYAAGGICGGVERYDLSYIAGCSNSGEIFCENGAGGICGDGSNVDISYSFNTGKIISYCAGGIGGYLVESYISYCYNTGEVVGVLPSASVDAPQSAYAGGICAGIHNSYISDSYNIGKLSLPEKTSVYSGMGGIVSFGLFDEANITDCFYDESCIPTSDAYISQLGTSLPTNDFKNGKAAYLLMLAEIDTENLTSDTSVWGQTLKGEKKDEYPVLSGAKVYEYGYGIYSNVSPMEFGILEYIPKNGSADLVVLNVPQDGSYYLMINGENIRSASVLDAIKLDVSLDVIKIDPLLPNERAEKETEVEKNDDTSLGVTTSSGDDGGPPSMITVHLEKTPDFKSGTRLMLWDNLTTITPLCEAFTIK